MILTLDDELASLVTDLKWQDWAEQFTIAVCLDAESEVYSARVVEEAEDIELLCRLDGVRADHWSINDLCVDLLCSVAYGFAMSRPNGSHRYVLSMLEAIRRHEGS